MEVVKGLDTSRETVQSVKEVITQMGKEMVEVNEFPGFVTSRMNCLIGPLLAKYVKAGRFGKKTGKGFYNYD